MKILNQVEERVTRYWLADAILLRPVTGTYRFSTTSVTVSVDVNTGDLLVHGARTDGRTEIVTDESAMMVLHSVGFPFKVTSEGRLIAG